MNNEIVVQKSMNNEIVQKSMNNEIVVQKNKYNKYKQKYLLLKYKSNGGNDNIILNNELIKYDMNNEIIHKNKYNKYKHKYLTLKYQLSGGTIDIKSIVVFIFNLFLNDAAKSIKINEDIFKNIIDMCNKFNGIFIDIINIINCIICNLQAPELLSTLKKIMRDSILNTIDLGNAVKLDSNNVIFKKIILQIYIYIKTNIPCTAEIQQLFKNIEENFKGDIKTIIKEIIDKGLQSIEDIIRYLNEKYSIVSIMIDSAVSSVCNFSQTKLDETFKIVDHIKDITINNIDILKILKMTQLGGNIFDETFFLNFTEFKNTLDFNKLLILILNLDCKDILKTILQITLIIIYIINYLTIDNYSNLFNYVEDIIIYILYIINKINIKDINHIINDTINKLVTLIISKINDVDTSDNELINKRNTIITNIKIIFKFISLLLSSGMPIVSNVICKN